MLLAHKELAQKLAELEKRIEVDDEEIVALFREQGKRIGF